MDLLLLSNSVRPGEDYLAYAINPIGEIVGARRKAVFVPYAGVTNAWDAYAAKVRHALSSLPIDVISVHETRDPVAAVREAECVIVGGGNTFHLLKLCREAGLLDVIREVVRAGVPYIGWSAGANLACPSISTTNDMPVVDPGGFGALGLIDFQINPHYNNGRLPGHMGETRDQRIAEFLVLNPTMPVLGLPEGDWLRVQGNTVALAGALPVRLFKDGQVEDIDAPASLVI